MFGVSKKSTKPTTYYALAFCIHVVAFVMMAIGMFTPYWSEITEDLITSNSVSVIYNKGLIVSCLSSTNDCRANANLTGSSKIFFAAFVIGIISIIFGFFILQLFCAGIFIRSCRESNLGVPIAVLSIFEGTLLIFVLVLFEISIGKDPTTGFMHRNDTFGFSRGLIIGSLVLYWISSFFIIGEYFRRKISTKEMPPTNARSKPPRGPAPRSYRNEPERGSRPPPYK